MHQVLVRRGVARAMAVAATVGIATLLLAQPAGAWNPFASSWRSNTESPASPARRASRRGVDAPSLQNRGRRRMLGHSAALLGGAALAPLAPKPARAGLTRFHGPAHEALHYHERHAQRARDVLIAIVHATATGELDVRELVLALREMEHAEQRRFEPAGGEGAALPAIRPESREDVYAALTQLTAVDSNVVAGIRALAAVPAKEFVAHATGVGFVASFTAPDRLVDEDRATNIARRFSIAHQRVNAQTKLDVLRVLEGAYRDVNSRLDTVTSSLAPALKAERAPR